MNFSENLLFFWEKNSNIFEKLSLQEQFQLYADRVMVSFLDFP